jgi:hypothetical protein
MNPERNFPLDVVITGRDVKVVAARGMKVAVGRQMLELDPSDPLLTVIPRFAGCLVVPPRLQLDVSPETVTARFWVTPLAEGDLPDACIELRYRGKLVESLPTPTQIVARTTARIFLGLGLLSPVILQTLEGIGWTFSQEVREGFPLIGHYFRFFGRSAGTLLFGSALLITAWICYRLTRPIAPSDPLTPSP